MTQDDERRAVERRRVQAIRIITAREKQKRFKRTEQLLLDEDARRRAGDANAKDRSQKS